MWKVCLTYENRTESYVYIESRESYVYTESRESYVYIEREKAHVPCAATNITRISLMEYIL